MGLDLLETRIGYVFKNKDLLKEAMTHPTFVNEHKESALKDNQRLEFLGDTIVNTAITRRIFKTFPDAKEGELTKIRASLISEATLSELARWLHIGDFLYLGKGEDLGQGRGKPSVLADAYEALVGAIFLDSSFDRACEVIERHLDAALDYMEEVTNVDYKSTFIEYCRSRYKCMPDIVLADETGPDHSKVFVMEVIVEGRVLGRGEGKNKKQASQMACKEALESLEDIQ